MTRKRKVKKKTNKKGLLIGAAALAVIGAAGNSGNKKSDIQTVSKSTVQPETQLIVQAEVATEIQSDITKIDYSDQGTEARTDFQELITENAENPLQITEKETHPVIYWVTSDVNVRAAPSTDSEILETLSNGAEISVYEVTDNWAEITYGADKAFVSADFISQSKPNSAIMVWIAAEGTKYHSNQYCSNMINPYQVSLDDAEAMGRTPCKKCYR